MGGSGVDLAAWEPRLEASLSGAAADAAHDLEHVRRVVRTAKRIAGVEGGCLEIVVPAAWLHDCVPVPKDSPDRPRASRLAAEEAARRLDRWGYPADFIPGVVHAVEAHSFSASIPAETLEARIVRDADRLDAIGCVGIARCLLLGGAQGKPLYDPGDPFCEARPPDDARFVVDHFFAKLLALPAAMATPTARAEAARRLERLRAFLEGLRDEIG